MAFENTITEQDMDPQTQAFVQGLRGDLGDMEPDLSVEHSYRVCVAIWATWSLICLLTAFQNPCFQESWACLAAEIPERKPDSHWTSARGYGE